MSSDVELKTLLDKYYKLFPNEQFFPEWFDISNREKIIMLKEAIQEKKDLSQTRLFDKYQEKVIRDKDYLTLAQELLDDDSLCLLKYADTTDYVFFSYGTKDGKPIFDECLIRVNKHTLEASYYKYTCNLKEIEKLTFKNINL